MSTANFGEFTVHVDNVLAAAALVKVIDILRDDGDLAIVQLLKLGESGMGAVWLNRKQLRPPLVIKILNHVWVSGKRL